MDLSKIPFSTWIWLGVIFFAFFICLILVVFFKKRNKLVANRRIIEYFPSLISTLGVLGTFWGITIGLMDFDTHNLDTSIPSLLDGLKTAFFTSLAGMIGPMILSAFINRKQDEKDHGISDINQAASEITKAVKTMSDTSTETMKSIQQQLNDQESDRKAFYRTLGDILYKISENQKKSESSIETLILLQRSQEENQKKIISAIDTLVLLQHNQEEKQKEITSAINSLVLLQRSQENSLSNIKEGNFSMATSILAIKESNLNQEVTIKSLATHSKEISESTYHLAGILDIISNINGIQDEINTTVGKMQDFIHGEVIQIEESMDKTNELLEYKFDEFTELLKKSNTEALVEVMKKVTEEFQKQMSSLLNKLIQENFDQLNKSVEKLNLWQQENKEMITALTHQYKEMSVNFEATSSSLTHVKEDTISLVGEGGKLRQLIDSLNKVIIEDERFIKITKELHETANLSKSNMQSFDESTKSLNEWIRKQRNFTDGVQVLIAKLEELNKIRDYGEQFWKGTKDKMEEGVNIIAQGSQTLNSQLTSLDRQFYGRLSATLAELDNCITKMVEQVKKRK